jgi:hypothetical protein
MISKNPRFTTTISEITSTTQRTISTTTNNSHGKLQFYKLETKLFYIFLNPYIPALQFILYSLTIKPKDLGGHLTPGPTGSTPPNGGFSFENWAGASKQNKLLAVGLQTKILFLRVHLTSGPTHSKGGICSSLFRSLETCPSRSC